MALWPGVGPFAPVFVRALRDVFEWPWERAAFVCTNLNILWTLSLGGWPKKKSQPTIKDVVTRKTKLVGCLPACLFSTAARMHGTLCKAVFTKVEAHKKSYSTEVPCDFTWDKKSLVVEVVARGEIADVLLAVQDTECLANLITEASDEQRSLAAFSFGHMQHTRQRTAFAFQ